MAATSSDSESPASQSNSFPLSKRTADDPAPGDISHEVTSALPTIMLARMLGVPMADTHRFHEWVDTIVFGNTTDADGSVRAAVELNDYVIALLTAHDAAPADDTFLTVMRDSRLREPKRPLSIQRPNQIRM